MEQYAYEYATENLCYPKNPLNERISLSKLFDMVAGTSTGSLLTTSIVIPAVDDPATNRYYADDAIKIYTTRGKDVF
jgi:patatin-like phospholipase/acyl hydrolase